MFDHVKVSRHNTKLGEGIPSVNLKPECTCRKDVPCYKKCYARKGRFIFGSNKEILQSNYDTWVADPERFEREIIKTAFFSKFFRWHSAGEIPDVKYLDMMVRIARKIPDTRFLCFTKKYDLIDTYIDENGELPQNLTIILSAWGYFLPENPHNLPVAYIRFKQGSCPIPEDALECPKYCGDCTLTKHSCWDLKHGQSVVFNEH